MLVNLGYFQHTALKGTNLFESIEKPLTDNCVSFTVLGQTKDSDGKSEGNVTQSYRHSCVAFDFLGHWITVLILRIAVKDATDSLVGALILVSGASCRGIQTGKKRAAQSLWEFLNSYAPGSGSTILSTSISGNETVPDVLEEEKHGLTMLDESIINEWSGMGSCSAKSISLLELTKLIKELPPVGSVTAPILKKLRNEHVRESLNRLLPISDGMNICRAVLKQVEPTSFANETDDEKVDAAKDELNAAEDELKEEDKRSIRDHLFSFSNSDWGSSRNWLNTQNNSNKRSSSKGKESFTKEEWLDWEAGNYVKKSNGKWQLKRAKSKATSITVAPGSSSSSTVLTGANSISLVTTDEQGLGVRLVANETSGGDNNKNESNCSNPFITPDEGVINGSDEKDINMNKTVAVNYFIGDKKGSRALLSPKKDGNNYEVSEASFGMKSEASGISWALLDIDGSLKRVLSEPKNSYTKGEVISLLTGLREQVESSDIANSSGPDE